MSTSPGLSARHRNDFVSCLCRRGLCQVQSFKVDGVTRSIRQSVNVVARMLCVPGKAVRTTRDMTLSDDIGRRIWQALEQAAAAKSPFNFLQLATVGLNGSPQLRTVVLRRCDRTRGELTFVTDVRSPKIRDIEHEPRVSLVGFDSAAMVQMRLSGAAVVVSSDIERRAIWNSLRGRTLVLFEAPLPPGTAVNDEGRPLAEILTGPDEPFDRFALVTVTLSRLEWLDLSSVHHVRCVLNRSGESWIATRLSP